VRSGKARWRLHERWQRSSSGGSLGKVCSFARALAGVEGLCGPLGSGRDEFQVANSIDFCEGFFVEDPAEMNFKCLTC
jgi:hypothetical protein